MVVRRSGWGWLSVSPFKPGLQWTASNSRTGHSRKLCGDARGLRENRRG